MNANMDPQHCYLPIVQCSYCTSITVYRKSMMTDQLITSYSHRRAQNFSGGGGLGVRGIDLVGMHILDESNM